MTKEIIKQKIRKAVEENPYKKDFRKVSLFGSYAHGKPKKNSDIDILIEFQPASKIGFFALARIQRDLEKKVGSKIDLLTPNSLSDFLKQEILQNAEKIYEKR